MIIRQVINSYFGDIGRSAAHCNSQARSRRNETTNQTTAYINKHEIALSKKIGKWLTSVTDQNWKQAQNSKPTCRLTDSLA